MKTTADSGLSPHVSSARAGTCTSSGVTGPWALLASAPGGGWRAADALGATAVLFVACWLAQLLAI